ncbi:MAG: translocation/assembly module TamB domain-containing protein [Ferruginibacter sp.]
MSKKTSLLLSGKSLFSTFLLLVIEVVLLIVNSTPVSAQNISSGRQGMPNKLTAWNNLVQALWPGPRLVNETIPISFIKKDTANQYSYYIKGMLVLTNGTISFSLTDSLVLNYKKWIVPPGNRVKFTPAGLSAQDFVLTKDSSILSVTNRQTLQNDSVDIIIRNVNLVDIAGIFNADSSTVAGVLNATIQATGLGRGFPAVAGLATISNILLREQPLGNLQANAEWINKNTIHTTLSLTQGDTLASAVGSLLLNNKKQQLDGIVDIKSLPVVSVQGFVKKILTLLNGNVNGLLALKGKLKKPQWKGELNIDSAKFSLNQSGAVYTIGHQKILLDHPRINFDHFTINDSLGHALVFNGNLLNADTSYALDMNMNSNDFTLINAPKAINNQVYGYAGIGANVAIKGTLAKPELNGAIELSDNTDITLVLPAKNSDKDIAGSVVRFIDRDTFLIPESRTFSPSTPTAKNISKYINRQLNFHLDKQAALTIIIDPATGDELKAQGEANLNGGYDSAENVILSGTYLLNSGYYELNYQFLKKRFILVPGSTITFSGNPLDAQVNIRAEYIANTASKDLLGNEVGAVEASIARSFKQNIPFRVVLFLKGSLNKPEISFDIQLPQTSSISNRLRTTLENKLVQLRADIAAINKQVFALLVLDRFVGEQSTDFFKGNGADFSDINKESVSKFLSAALDQVASDLFKGINVDLNLNSFKDFTNYNTIQKTDLNVEVSKNFLNDRLNVTVGRNFGIEGQDGSAKAAQQKGSRFLPDVTVNYKLSTDGRYMLRSYNKNPLEVILDGYIVETGVAFIITMDYEKYRELFINKNKKVGGK